MYHFSDDVILSFLFTSQTYLERIVSVEWSSLLNDIQWLKKRCFKSPSADKTSNIYKATQREYNKLLKYNTTKSYKKSTDRLEKASNMEAKNIAKKIQISDRIDCLAKTPAFITLNDHKDNIQSSLHCRLINPSKNELGKVSKSILENINQHLVKLLYVNQWKNSSSVMEWFKKRRKKELYLY